MNSSCALSRNNVSGEVHFETKKILGGLWLELYINHKTFFQRQTMEVASLLARRCDSLLKANMFRRACSTSVPVKQTKWVLIYAGTHLQYTGNPNI